MERAKPKSQAKALLRHSKTIPEKAQKDGNIEIMVSTGSTLLDLAISGKRKRGGGIPAGILLEAFGPEGSGKTVLLCEIGGAIQRKGGELLFNDPEARLNKQFAKMFDLDTENLTVEQPDTVTQVMQSVHKWEPTKKAKVHGIMTDSLAALSTNIEMDNDEGDKMGMRRAKEFSEGFRKVCRKLKANDLIMACSNQIRDKADATGYGEQFTVPGGKAIAFYASVRLRFHKPEKITRKKTIRGKEVSKVIGVITKVDVYKNSVDAPYRTAPLYILFDYGIDDVRANLQYLKDFSGKSVFTLNETILDKSLDASVAIIEEAGLEKELKEAVIDLWEEIEGKFKIVRKKKIRD